VNQFGVRAADNPCACRTALGSSDLVAAVARAVNSASRSLEAIRRIVESQRFYGIRNKLALYETAIKHEIWAATSLWEKRATLLISGQLNNKEIGMIWNFLPP
jgi:hypothetical protein